MNKIAFAAIAFLAASTNASQSVEGFSTGSFRSGIPCTPCAESDTSAAERAAEECAVIVKVNYFASETGYYEIDGCVGVNPTLHLTVGRTYLFDQTDDSNWYHLIGFAYEADGAHVDVDELEPGIARSDSNCSASLSCPAPMYYNNGEYRGVYSNIPELVPIPDPPSDDFGLDAVEPLFFHPFGDWQGYGTFVTALKFDDMNYDQDIFYFCHVHAGMTARIKLLDSEGHFLNKENTPAIPYEYAEIDAFDYKCGTYNLTDYSAPDKLDTCPDVTVCMEDIALSEYANCVQAMNCHMMASMTTNAVGHSALFCHQMIPHHQNAINMAKSLLHSHGFICEEVEEEMEIPWECELLPILYDIIKVQAFQNIDMRHALDELGEEEYENCDVPFVMKSDVVPSRKLMEPEFMKEETERKTEECTYISGLECELCEDEDGDCLVKVRINLLAGQWGYFEIEGCEGVNPTIHMEVGRTYLFDQSDVSNWYHLIGFSYFADGAHVGVDELEPGIAPGDSNCAENMSCPAPMYWMNGIYMGQYSNTDHLVPVNENGSDDFGLDAVEPLFFFPLEEWGSYGPFVTSLTFDDENFDQDIFYFCHVHSGMTGRIKLIGSDGSKLSETDSPEIPYDYDCVSPFDKECGTFGLDGFQSDMNEQCPESFICYKDEGPIGDAAKCVDAMDCHMLTGMTVVYGDDGKDSRVNDVILFLREMIPHHQNAVNMAKNLMTSGEIDCSLEDKSEEGGTSCVLDSIARGIINTQNSQIQAMQGLLEGFGVLEEKQCVTTAESNASKPKSMKSLLGVFVALFVGWELLAL